MSGCVGDSIDVYPIASGLAVSKLYDYIKTSAYAMLPHWKLLWDQLRAIPLKSCCYLFLSCFGSENFTKITKTIYALQVTHHPDIYVGCRALLLLDPYDSCIFVDCYLKILLCNKTLSDPE